MLATKLKETTLPAHQALEKKLIGVIKSVKSREAYADLLCMMYGFYAALEPKISGPLAAKGSINFEKRRKAAAILSDIKALGITDVPKVSPMTPNIKSPAQALGALYVLEGSTLGGQIITRMIRNQLPSEDAFTFFNGYGEQTQVMWQKFKEHLQGPFDAREEEEIISAATDTFDTFRNWIEHYAVN